MKKFLIDTFIENETFLEEKKHKVKNAISEKVKPLEENLSDLNKSITTNQSDSEEIKSFKEKVSSLEERIKKLENKISINDYLGPNRIGGKPYLPYPLPQPTIPYTPVTPYYIICTTSTGEINKK
jgi:hypothetical protein